MKMLTEVVKAEKNKVELKINVRKTEIVRIRSSDNLIYHDIILHAG